MYGFYGLDEEEDKSPTVVYRYRVKYTCAGWDREMTMMAESAQQCRNMVDTIDAPETRMRDYPEGRKDSLQVLLLSKVVLPFILTDE